MLKEFRRLKNDSDWFVMVQTRPNASKIQLNQTPKYFIQSPLPLPATFFQRPLDNFVNSLIFANSLLDDPALNSLIYFFR